jgi:NADPH:quinone reductase-like Zn-dependent oxidoreductase
LSAAGKAEAARGFKHDVLPAIMDGRIKPLIDSIYSFDELPAAKARMDASAMVGKIAVKIA